jgi:uncharacterized protein YlaN (UPF0358 family)
MVDKRGDATKKLVLIKVEMNNLTMFLMLMQVVVRIWLRKV